MEDTKWDRDERDSEEIADPVLRSGGDLFSAVVQARFGHFIEPELPTLASANKVIEHARQSLEAALEAAVAGGAHHRSRLVQETRRDYELLLARSTALFPAYGLPIDTTATGFLGPLWRETTSNHVAPSNSETSDAGACPHNEVQRLGTDSTNSSISVRSTPSGAVALADGTERHSPENGYLYKYVSFDTLLKILENPTLRFSPISAFNDPFDGQLLPVRKFGFKHFFDALRDEVARLVTKNNEPIFKLPCDMSTEAAISAAAQIVMDLLHNDKGLGLLPQVYEQPESVEPLAKLLRPLIYLAQQGHLGSSEQAVTVLNDLLARFQEHRVSFSIEDGDRRVIPALGDIVQVLCLSEVPDSLLMWSHYADHHKGAVLKFDLDSCASDYLATARPVVYQRELPSIEHPRSAARRYLGLDVESVD